MLRLMNYFAQQLTIVKRSFPPCQLIDLVLCGALKHEIRMLIRKLTTVVVGVRYTLTREVSTELGISAGFNSESGD